MSWDHRSLEGALYGLSSRPEGRPVAANLSPTPSASRPGPRVPSGVMRRLEVDLVLRRSLTEADRQVMYEHYVANPPTRHPYRERKRIIGTLLMALNASPLDGQSDDSR